MGGGSLGRGVEQEMRSHLQKIKRIRQANEIAPAIRTKAPDAQAWRVEFNLTPQSCPLAPTQAISHASLHI